jgi:hypothetical protein
MPSIGRRIEGALAGREVNLFFEFACQSGASNGELLPPMDRKRVAVAAVTDSWWFWGRWRGVIGGLGNRLGGY